jgi:hypothetical protein
MMSTKSLQKATAARVHRQCLTSIGHRNQNLQVQVNSKSKINQIREINSKSVAHAPVSVESGQTCFALD